MKDEDSNTPIGWISIKGLRKSLVLAMLFNNAKVNGIGSLDPRNKDSMSIAEAEGLLASGTTYFDYIRGRVLKVDLSGDAFDPWLYNRDNGEDKARMVVASARDAELQIQDQFGVHGQRALTTSQFQRPSMPVAMTAVFYVINGAGEAAEVYINLDLGLVPSKQLLRERIDAELKNHDGWRLMTAQELYQHAVQSFGLAAAPDIDLFSHYQGDEH